MSLVNQVDHFGVGKPISTLGIGCWQAGGSHVNRGRSIGWHGVDPIELNSAYELLFEEGVNVFDTADSYGPDYLSARRLGASLRRLPRESYFICGKVGYSEQTPSLAWCHVRPRVKGLLDALKLRHLDLFSLHHNGMTEADFSDAVDTLHHVRTEGMATLVAVRVGHVPTFALQRSPDLTQLSATRDLRLATVAEASAILMAADFEPADHELPSVPIILNKVLNQGAFLKENPQEYPPGDTRNQKDIFSATCQARIIQRRDSLEIDKEELLRYYLTFFESASPPRLGFVGIRNRAQAIHLIRAVRSPPIAAPSALKIAAFLREFQDLK